MIAGLFPGQGSQSIGMGQFLYDNFSIAKECFEQASDAISVNFKKLLFDSDSSTLELTENAQPAIVLVSVTTWRVLHTLMDLSIHYTAGHSVGEYSALVASEVFSFEDAIRSVRKRGQSMQSAVPVGQGGMLAVLGLSSEQVLKMCKWAEEQTGLKPLEPANFNAPGQIVLSGSAQIISWLRENFKIDIFEPLNENHLPKKVKLIPLKVSAPFHCSLMKPAQVEMEAALSKIPFNKAKIPVIQNVSALPESDGDKIREQLIEQVTHSVQWVESMNWLKQTNVQHCIEFGSGKVLSGLHKKIDNKVKVYPLNSLEDIKTLESSLNKK